MTSIKVLKTTSASFMEHQIAFLPISLVTNSKTM